MTDAQPSCQHCGSKSGLFWVNTDLDLVCADCRAAGPFLCEDGTVLRVTAIVKALKEKDANP